MGRARGTTPAAAVAAADQFATVFGSRRGVGRVDLAGPDNEAARRANAHLFDAARRGELTEPLRELREHRHRLHAPLAERLQAEVVQALSRETQERWGPVAGSFVDRTCMAAMADTIVTGPDELLHLWPDGKAYGLRVAEGERSRTACGLTMKGPEFARTGRDVWYRSRHGNLKFELCPQCADHEPDFEECQGPDDGQLFTPSAQAAFAADLDARCAQKLAEHVSATRQRGERNLRQRVREQYHETVVSHAHRRLLNGGAALAERILADRSPELVGVTDTQVQSLTVDDFTRVSQSVAAHTLGGRPHPEHAAPASWTATLDSLGPVYRIQLKLALTGS